MKILQAMWFTVFALLALWLLLMVLVYVFQSRLIYFPERELVQTPAQLGLPYQDVYLNTRDGARIHGWYVRHVRARATVLYLHGNAGNISQRLESVARFYRMGLSVLIIDYHGYGLSTGSPGETATYEDARAAWSYLTMEQKVPVRQLIVFGRSLGGAVAVWLAREYHPAALIIESTFTSVVDLARNLYPFLPVRLLVRVRYPSLERIARVACPVLVIHSRDDEIIPFEHGLKLYQAAGPPREFLELTGGHNEGYVRAGVKYFDGLQRFIYAHSAAAAAS